MATTDGTLVDVPDVVSNALARTAAEQGFKSPSFDVRSGSQNRDGYMSTLYRCVIRDENAAGPAPLSVMVKISREGMDSAMKMLFVVEGWAYTRLFPELVKIAGLQKPLPWTRCFLSEVEGEHPLSIVLEDFRPQGFVMKDRSKLVDEHHLRLALEQLGKLHGAGMALEKLKPDLAKAVRGNTPDLARRPELFAIMKPFLAPVPKLPGLVEHRYPAGSEVQTVLRKLCCDVFPKSFNKFMWPKPREDGVGCTFIHGDCHTNNMAFKYDKDGAVTACKLYDFQATHWRLAAQDLVYLLFCNTAKSMRDKHLEPLLRGYLDTVWSTMRAAGCEDPESIFSWDTLLAQVRRFAVPALCFSPIFECLQVATEDVVDDLRSHVADLDRKDRPADDQGPSLLKPTQKLVDSYIGLIETVVSRGWLPTVEELERYAAED